MTFRTMLIPTAHVQLARDLAVAIDPTGSQGLFTTPLTNGTQVTHYISSGIISDALAQLLPCTTWAQDENGWVQVSHSPGNPQATIIQATVTEIEALFAASDISEQEPFTAMSRMNLAIESEVTSV